MQTRTPGRIQQLAPGLLTALMLSLIPGWSGCEKPSSSASNKSAAQKLPPLAGQPIPDKMSVKVLTSGSGTKRKLRYRFRAGETHKILVTIAMSVGATTKERSVPAQKMPAMQMLLSVQHREVTPKGTLKYTFKLVKSGLVGAKDGVMKRRFSKVLGPALQMLVGLTGTGEVTPKGLAKLGGLKIPDNMPGPARQAIQSLKEQLNQLATALPDAAVGVGAKWVVTQPMQRAKLRMSQRATYTVVELKGSAVTLDVKIEAFAPEQELKTGRLPAGAKATLHSLKSSGTGRVLIDLTRTAPQGAFRHKTHMDQTISSRGKSQRMQLDITVGARFTTKAPATP